MSCGGGDDNGNDPVIPQTPAIIVDKTSISFDETMVSKSSSASSILIESKNVDSGLNISSSDGFEISFIVIHFSGKFSSHYNLWYIKLKWQL